jgi:two-component system chemotaxis response regulator CheB
LDEMPRQVAGDMAAQVNGAKRGALSFFTCPECGGSLWQVNETEIVRFRCHVGHAYYGEALLQEQSEALEAALWTAVRTFKEKTVLARQLAARERSQGKPAIAERFEEAARQAERYGELIQQHVLGAGRFPEIPGAGATEGTAPAAPDRDQGTS